MARAKIAAEIAKRQAPDALDKALADAMQEGRP